MSMKRLFCSACKKFTKHDSKHVRYSEKLFGKEQHFKKTYFGCRRCGTAKDVKIMEVKD